MLGTIHLQIIYMSFLLDENAVAISEHCLTYGEQLRYIHQILPKKTIRQTNLYDLLRTDPAPSSVCNQIWKEAQEDLSRQITNLLLDLARQFEAQLEQDN